jgi:hypothetical protein
MTVAKEYWNIPKPSDDFLMAQGINLTVFVDHATNGFGASEITAGAGIFIAFLALGVSFWQGYVTRRHNILSLQPKLTIESNTYLGESSFEYDVKNVGLGPAEITSFKVFVKGQEVACRIGESPIHIAFTEKINLVFDKSLLVSLGEGDKEINSSFDCVQLSSGESIPSNGKKMLFKFRINGYRSTRDIFYELLEKEEFDVVIGYRDLYHKTDRVLKFKDSY